MIEDKRIEKIDLDNLKIDTKVLFNEFAETRNTHIREELIERHLYIAEILSKNT